MKGEVHIVLVWPNALEHLGKILDDLAARFTRRALYRVRWSDAHFARNISRFYGKSLPLDSDKIGHCGTGPFIVAVIKDEAPDYGFRWTSKGARRVNINLFDAKQRYREWTGGGHRIHGTDNTAEADHDAALLFGRPAEYFLDRPAEPWDAPAEELVRDLSGADGWRDLTELFEVLNLTHPYVVLRNFDALPEDMGDGGHGDIDLLVEDLDNAAFICNAEPVFDTPHRVFMHVPVNGQPVPFDFRHQGDGYYDKLWQRDILDQRVLNERGFYIPAPVDHFYSLLYHAVIHKPQVAADYLVKLPERAVVLGRVEASPAHFTEYRWMKGILSQFFNAKGYDYSEPQDPSVYVNRAVMSESAEIIENRFELLLQATILTPPHHTKRNDWFFSRVWRMTMPDGSMAALKLVEALSEAARPLLFREHEFLLRLKDGPFARHLAHGNLNESYFLLTRWIDGFDLREGPATVDYFADAGRRDAFRQTCRKMAERLEAAGISHRDIREMNILVDNNKPVLIDFGWAMFEGEAGIFTPENLEAPDDRSAIDQMLGRVLGEAVQN